MNTTLKTIVMVSFLLSQFSAFSYGQNEEYFPGFIIKSEGDTLKGLVNYTDWKSNPDKIWFKKGQESEMETYFPMDILAFGINEDVFITTTVDVEVSTTEISMMSENPTPKLETRLVFLKKLIEGKKSLYYYRHAGQKENFYIENNGKYELLIHKLYLRRNSGRSFQAHNNRYIGQLKLYFEGCLQVSRKLVNMRYNLKSMISIFEKYYSSCSETSASYHIPKKLHKSNNGVLAGVSHTDLRFISTVTLSPYPNLTDRVYTSSTNFVCGYFFDKQLFRNMKNLQLHNEFIFNTFETTTNFMVPKYENEYSVYDIRISCTYLHLNSMLRYKIPAGPGAFMISAGGSAGFTIGMINNQTITKHFYSTIHTGTSSAIPYHRPYSFGYNAGLGYEYGRFGLEMRYAGENGMSNIDGIKSPVRQYFVLLSYHFKKQDR